MCNHWHKEQPDARRRHKPGSAYKVFEQCEPDGCLLPPYGFGYNLKQSDTLVWEPRQLSNGGRDGGFCAFTSLASARIVADWLNKSLNHFSAYPVHKVTFKKAIGTHNEAHIIADKNLNIIIMKDFTVGPCVYTPKEATR